MTLQRFGELAATHGAARRRWPVSEQALHERFAGTAEGAVALADAARLDAFLDGWRVDGTDRELERRIVAAALARPGRRRAATAWVSSAFAACALLGFAVGFMQAPADTDAGSYSELLLGSDYMEEIL